MADSFKSCSISGCNQNAHPKARGVRGWCRNHYNRFLRHGDPLGGQIRADNSGKCSIDGCHQVAIKRTWCRDHYGRWQRHGSPIAGGVTPGSGEKWLRDHVNHDGLECLIFPFGLEAPRYRTARLAGKKMEAHRAMCVLVHGEPPTKDHHAAHGCGNGHLGCVHPKHLRWATPKENQGDMVAHGTSPQGTRNAQAKLSEADVRKIRSLIGNMTITHIAAMFGVSIATISMIKSRKTWGWLT